jgi:hypothetical protein
LKYRTLVTDHLDNSGLGVDERLKILLLSVVEEKDTMDGVIYCEAVGQAGVYPVVFF